MADLADPPYVAPADRNLPIQVSVYAATDYCVDLINGVMDDLRAAVKAAHAMGDQAVRAKTREAWVDAATCSIAVVISAGRAQVLCEVMSARGDAIWLSAKEAVTTTLENHRQATLDAMAIAYGICPHVPLVPNAQQN